MVAQEIRKLAEISQNSVDEIRGKNGSKNAANNLSSSAAELEEMAKII